MKQTLLTNSVDGLHVDRVPNSAQDTCLIESVCYVVHSLQIRY